MKKLLMTSAAVAIALAATLTACTSDENEPVLNENKAVDINVAVKDGADTRAGIEATENYLPTNGNAYLHYGAIPGASASHQAVYASNGTAWSSTAPIYWNNIAIADSYPFFLLSHEIAEAAQTISSSNLKISSGAATTVSIDAEANVTASDLLAAYATPDARGGALSFDYYHALSKLIITVTKAEYMDLEYSNITMQIKGIKKNFTFAKAATLATTAAPLTITAGETATSELETIYKSSSENKAEFEAILPNQEIAAGSLTLQIAVGGNNYTWTNTGKAITLTQSKQTTLSLNLTSSTVELAGSNPISVEEWGTETSVAGGDWNLENK